MRSSCGRDGLAIVAIPAAIGLRSERLASREMIMCLSFYMQICTREMMSEGSESWTVRRVEYMMLRLDRVLEA